MWYSVQPTIIGKSSPSLLGAGWEPREGSRADFVQVNFIQGQAITAGHFQTDHRNDEGWLGADLYIVDIDSYPDDGTEWTLERVWSDPFIQQYCFAAFPSSRYNVTQPKLHLYFQGSRIVDDKEHYRAVSEYIRGKIAIPTDPALSKPSQAVYGTVFQYVDEPKSFDSPLLFFRPDAPLFDVDMVELDHVSLWEGAPVLDHLRHSGSRAISARAKEHETQPVELRERVVLEALAFALKGWKRRSHEEWKALLMSAYMGCNRQSVAQAIMDSVEVEWRPGEREAIPAWWNKHKPREGTGYTVATLFLLARNNGWLTQTSSDITTYEEFEAEEVGDFLLSVLPKRALVLSNTGTGKTQGAIAMLKALGTPRSIFFAPSIKLCTNLSHTLTLAGVENTLYIDNGITKDADTLREAHVLVTTLQTFAVKVLNSGIDIKQYGMVVIDESDDLFSSFVLSGTWRSLHAGSHVTREQARVGMLTLQRIFSEVEHVLMLDGTATMLSVRVAEAFTTVPLRVYKNRFKRQKAPVTLFATLAEARARFLTAVRDREQVVLATDTRREALLMEKAVYSSGYATADEVICITGQTNFDERVREFFSDVEAGAKKYRVVIYNSAMGVGVSIVDTCPDVFIQVASYISPRKNLQILNRYRRQSEVCVYMPQTENLYSETYGEALDRLRQVTAHEYGLFGLTTFHSVPMAEIISNFALLAATDLREQLRARGTYYRHLLEQDGREVREGGGGVLDEETLTAAREALDAEREEVMQGWFEVAPIDRDNPPLPGASAVDIAKGLLHALVARTIPHYESVEMAREQLAKLVLDFGSHIKSLLYLHQPLEVVDEAKAELQDIISSTSRQFHLSRMDLLAQVGAVFADTSTRLTDAELEMKAADFLGHIADRRAVYNTIAGSRNSYERILERSDTPGEAAYAMIREILKICGLKVGKTNGQRREDGSRERLSQITNVDEAMTFLGLVGVPVDRLQFSGEAMTGLFWSTKMFGPTIANLPREARNMMLRERVFEV